MVLLDLFHNQGKGRPIGGGSTYIDKVLSIQPANLIGYWPMNDASGAVALDYSGQGNNGAYTGVSLANAPGPDGGNSCPLFDGTSDFNNIYSI